MFTKKYLNEVSKPTGYHYEDLTYDEKQLHKVDHKRQLSKLHENLQVALDNGALYSIGMAVARLTLFVLCLFRHFSLKPQPFFDYVNRPSNSFKSTEVMKKAMIPRKDQDA